jgi:hypothetical protein
MNTRGTLRGFDRGSRNTFNVGKGASPGATSERERNRETGDSSGCLALAGGRRCRAARQLAGQARCGPGGAPSISYVEGAFAGCGRALAAWGDDHYATAGPRRLRWHAEDEAAVDANGRCMRCRTAMGTRRHRGGAGYRSRSVTDRRRGRRPTGTAASAGRRGTRRYRGASWARTAGAAARPRPLPRPS